MTIALALLLLLLLLAAVWLAQARSSAQRLRTLQKQAAVLEQERDRCLELARAAEQRQRQAQRMQVLGRLTAGVAHDFNNVLGVISNSAHLIERATTGRAELALPVAATLRAVEAGSRLSRMLLDLVGRRPGQPQRLDLGTHLPSMQELLNVVLGTPIRLTVAVAPGTWPVHVDACELQLALLNLAFNARDALPKGGQVWLHARNGEAADRADAASAVDGAEGAESPEGAEAADVAGEADGADTRPFVMLTVTDDGTGADDDMVARGLGQVLDFCALAGGKARLVSTRGLGTTVSLQLPAAPAEPPAPPAIAPATA